MARPIKHPKTGIYYFRRAVPSDLRDKLGWEIKKPLGTKSPVEAKRLFVAEMERCDRTFDLARTGFQLSHKQASALAGRWLTQKLEKDSTLRDTTQPEEEKGWTDEQGTPYDILLDWMESAESGQDLGAAVGDEVDALLRQEAISLEKGSDSYAHLVREIFRAKVKLYKVLERRFLGNWSAHKELDDYPEFVPSALTVTGRGKRPIARVGGDRLSDLFDAWKRERKPAPKTATEFERGIRRFVQFHGDVRAVNIDRPMVRSFKEGLQRFPRVLVGKQRSMSMRQVLHEGDAPPPEEVLSEGSISKQIGALSAVLEWASRNGYFDGLPNWSNPTLGVKPQDRNPKEKRLGYEAADLDRIFRFPVFTSGERPVGGGGEAAKWLPLLALYSGARLEELGQLRTTDVGCDKEVFFIDINTRDAGKRTKNDHSRRKVPIHQELLHLGFLDYVEERRKTTDTRLFPDLQPDKLGKMTANWSRWWGRYCRRHGFSDRRKVFHSFRHAFKSACREAGLGKEIHDAMSGHSSGGVGDSYGEGYPVTVLAQELAKVTSADLNLTHLYVMETTRISGRKIRGGITTGGRLGIPPVPPAA
jgi:integrase